MAVPITITETSGNYSISPTAPNSPDANSFQLTNNCSAAVTVFFSVCGNAASPFPASTNITASGGSYTTPVLNSGYVVFTVTPQGGANAMHVIHIGSTMHQPKHS